MDNLVKATLIFFNNFVVYNPYNLECKVRTLRFIALEMMIFLRKQRGK